MQYYTVYWLPITSDQCSILSDSVLGSACQRVKHMPPATF